MPILVDLVRSPRALLDEPLERLAPTLLLATVVGAAMFGAAVGVHHSGLQALSAAAKMPLVLLVPPLVAVPAVRSLAEAFGLALPARRAAAGLICVARIALFAAALAPLLWLFSDLGGYRWACFIATVTLGLAGLPGTMVLALAPDGAGGPRRVGVTLGAVVIFGAVAAQTVWLLCPFVLRSHLPVVFVQAPESDVFTQLAGRAHGRPPRRPDAAPEEAVVIGYQQ
jgi:hypothetical protein